MPAGSPRFLRTLNERATLELLLGRGPLTRGELESLTGLSKAATAEVLRRLESARLVRKGGRKPGSAGPAAHMWTLDGSSSYVAGVDVTPSALDVAVADLTGEIVGERRIPTPEPYDAIETLSAALTDATTAAGIQVSDLDRITIGMPGVVDVNGDRLASAIQVPSWSDVHPLGPLRAALGNDRVHMENDVNLVAVEEMVKGAAVGAESFVLFWLGQGIGAGVVLKGSLWRGASGRSGEIGSVVVPDPVEVGRVFGPEGGPLDQILGAEAVAALAQAHGLGADDAITGGHPAFLADLAARVAVALTGVIGVLDPDLVVLGGPLCRAGGKALRERVAARLAGTPLAQTPLATSTVSGNAVRAGAVEFALSLAREQIFTAGTAGR
ncbi:ROK family transcriptional regulator [Planotetraspora sp. GP83]|uniref:ROK family transcriptional regulator n=1 Tax=Planotetraspora sp. GP83 TaxID=3156264 RepID=UPI0035165FE4